MKPSSSTSDLLGAALFHDADVDAAVSDQAVVAAMLDAEAALSAAAADVGIVPRNAADAIGRACESLGGDTHIDTHIDMAALGRESLSAGNPVPALVRRISAAVPDSARPWVHYGATSQDVVDTALALVTRNALAHVCGHLATAGDACAALAQRHCDTIVIGRTLGQQAVPTTFGRKAAGWLVALDDATDRIGWVRERRLAIQFGGAVGTLAGYGDTGDIGIAAATALARRLDLACPVLPWHTDRSRVLDVASATASAGAATGKIATDVVLMAQTEVGEVSFARAGGSSAMPHKRNPVDAVLVRAAGVRIPGLVATLYAAAGGQEHERAAGGWHAEWAPLLDLIRIVGGMSARTARVLAGLTVHPDRMRANVDRTGGLVMAEAVAARLASVVGRLAAHDIVTRCADRAADDDVAFADVLLDDPDVTRHLAADEVKAALEPAGWLGSAGAMVDRAVEAHRRR